VPPRGRGLPRSYIRHGRRPPGLSIGTAPPTMLGGGRQRHDGELRTGRPLHGFVVDQPSPRSAMGRGLLGVPAGGRATGPPARSTRWRSPSVTRCRSTPQGARHCRSVLAANASRAGHGLASGLRVGAAPGRRVPSLAATPEKGVHVCGPVGPAG